MNTTKPVRQLTDTTVIIAFAVQLFINLSRPEQMQIIRIILRLMQFHQMIQQHVQLQARLSIRQHLNRR